MKTITAIETQYAGCRFRSRAEAQMKVNKMLGVTSRRESRADIPVDRITAVITQLKEWLVGEGVDPQKILDPFAA